MGNKFEIANRNFDEIHAHCTVSFGCSYRYEGGVMRRKAIEVPSFEIITHLFLGGFARLDASLCVPFCAYYWF